MGNAIRVSPAWTPVAATQSVPGSKSLTNRALTAAALANGTSIIENALFADDTERMVDCLQRMGFAVATDPAAQRIEITGRGGHVPGADVDCFCGNSGTTIRFCTALAAAGYGDYCFDGVPRMRQRPIGPLVDALRTLGAIVEYEQDDGFPPLKVYAKGLGGGTAVFKDPPSSQFVSALLLVAPAAKSDVLIEVEGTLPSAPYVTMTTAVIESFGPTVISEITPDRARFIIPAPQPYVAQNYRIEPDASNASYFLAAPAVAGGKLTVQNLGTDSIQGDAAFVDILEQLGCTIERAAQQLTVIGPPRGTKLRAGDFDLNAMPDMVQTLAVLALFADGPITIRNVANLRLKETDRLAALTTELTRLGANVDESPTGLTVHPPDRIRPARIETYDDHRMAMSFALVGLAVDGIEIDDPGCVAKTFPDFFDRWAQLSR